MIELLKQLPLDYQSQKALLDARTSIFNDDVNSLAEDMYTGKITLGQWEESMRKLVREMHASIAAVGKGGWESMTKSDWGKLGSQLKKQYKYLHGFAENVDANRETVALGSIQQRARMYGEAAKAALYIASTPIEIIEQLPWMPKDGSTECLVNCKCIWMLKVVKVSRSSKTIEATWRMTPAEHCDDCIARSGFKVVISVPKAVEVPAIIGGM